MNIMKYSKIIAIVFLAIYFSSCKKEESLNPNQGFVTAVPCDSNVAVVGMVQLSDGNYVIVSRDYLEEIPGRMVKMDTKGNVLWEKRVSAATRILWQTFPVPGIGFATFGIDDYNGTSTFLKVCIYDNNGELIQTKSLSSGYYNNWKLPQVMLPLKNGGFAFAGGDMWDQRGHLIITDNTFKLLSNRTYYNPTNNSGFFIRGICEKADGDIMLTATTSYGNSTGDSIKVNPIVLRTGPTGIKKTQNFLPDPIYNESPNYLINYKDGMLGVSSRMTGDIVNSNDGLLVGYLNNTFATLISGRITITQYDSAGLALNRKEIIGYPGYGQINVIKTTVDGGFIMCGTVNQANSNAVVSDTKIYLLKIDANLNEQWSKTIYTSYPSYGVDVLPTADGGYLVSGYHRSMDKRFEMLVIKTDATGNIK